MIIPKLELVLYFGLGFIDMVKDSARTRIRIDFMLELALDLKLLEQSVGLGLVLRLGLKLPSSNHNFELGSVWIRYRISVIGLFRFRAKFMLRFTLMLDFLLMLDLSSEL